MSKQWKCPECRCTSLKKSQAHAGHWRCVDCKHPYGALTIQALTTPFTGLASWLPKGIQSGFSLAAAPNAFPCCNQIGGLHTNPLIACPLLTQPGAGTLTPCEGTAQCPGDTHNYTCTRLQQHFTTSPPGYAMPWEGPTYYSVNGEQITEEEFAKLGQGPSTPVCDCGGEKTGGSHSNWCSTNTEKKP